MCYHRCYFGVSFPRCCAIREKNTKIILSWAHKQFATQVYKCFPYFETRTKISVHLFVWPIPKYTYKLSLIFDMSKNMHSEYKLLPSLAHHWLFISILGLTSHFHPKKKYTSNCSDGAVIFQWSFWYNQNHIYENKRTDIETFKTRMWAESRKWVQQCHHINMMGKYFIP